MPRLISDKYREVQQTMLDRFNQLKANKKERPALLTVYERFH